MRVNKWGVGVVLAAAVLLTGCSTGSEKPAEEKPNTDSSVNEETSAPASDCPELAEGATLDGTELGSCVVEAMSDAAGYAAKTTMMGMESTARYNPAEDAVEANSPAGSMIVIGDDIWVKSPTSDWQVGDAASSDPIIAALSQGAVTVAETDPSAAAAALAGEFTVTGTGSRLGQDVFLVSGTAEVQGMSVDVVYEITSDYVALASTSTGEVSGQAIEVAMEITEWDVKQDIVAPI